MKKEVDKPAPALVTVVQLQKIFGVTRKTISEWVKKGMPKKSHGVYDSVECFSWWQDNINIDKTTGDISIRDRYWLAKAEVEEVKAAKLKGMLAPKEEFEKQEAYRMACLRGSLLALPGRLALTLEGKRQEDIRELLKHEIFTILEQFRRNKSYLADGSEPDFEEEATLIEPVAKPKKKKTTKKRVAKKVKK